MSSLVSAGNHIQRHHDSTRALLVAEVHELEEHCKSHVWVYNTPHKDFIEFLSEMVYKSHKEAAFLEAKMGLEKSLLMLSYFNKPDMFDKPEEPK